MAKHNDSSGGNRNQGGARGDQGSGAGGRQAPDSGSRERGSGSGSMSVREAGHKGGQRLSELVEKGKQRG